MLTMSDKSINSARQDEVSPIRPQKNDRVLVTTGLNQGREGDLISIRGGKAMIKEEDKNFITADFDALAKVYSNQAFGKLVRKCWHKCFACKSYTPRRYLFSESQLRKGIKARCNVCVCIGANMV